MLKPAGAGCRGGQGGHGRQSWAWESQTPLRKPGPRVPWLAPADLQTHRERCREPTINTEKDTNAKRYRLPSASLPILGDLS